MWEDDTDIYIFKGKFLEQNFEMMLVPFALLFW